MSKPTLLVPGNVKLPQGVDGSPIEYISNWVKKRMIEYGGKGSGISNRLLIVQSKTGSGKSTVLPVYMFRILRSKDTNKNIRYQGPNIICTQPRILTSMALSYDVSAENSPWNEDMIFGTTVGYQTGPNSILPVAGLIYATIGILTAQLQLMSDIEIMDRYRFIIMDEAHERSLQSDMALLMLRDFYVRNSTNPKLPFLILTSATINVNMYARYFGVNMDNVVSVEGRTYPIETHWPAQGFNNYITGAVKTVTSIHENNTEDTPDKADILVFVPGATEANMIAQQLSKLNDKYADPDSTVGTMLVLIINRDVVVSRSGDYTLVFEDSDNLPLVGNRVPLRRVIISTVVAETGITIDTLKYVIDCGWNRSKEIYQPWNISGIITLPVTKSKVEQRRGRAGRLFPGNFYPLYTKNVYNSLDDQQLPDIVTNGVAEIYLSMIKEQQRQKVRLGQKAEYRVEDINLIDPPAIESLLCSGSIAATLGFVSHDSCLPTKWPPECLESLELEAKSAEKGYGLTTLGNIASMFTRVSMEAIRILFAGYVWDVAATDLITLVAMIGTSTTDLLTRRELRIPTDDNSLPPGANILRESLPSYMVSRLGGAPSSEESRKKPITENEAFYYRAKLLLADDFIEAILIYDTFIRRMDSAQDDIQGLIAWCKDVGLNWDTMIRITSYREVVMEEMIIAGMNPYRLYNRRLYALRMEEFTPGITRIKRCIYDGLRGNLIKFVPDHADGGPCYISKHGVKVKTPPLFNDATTSRLCSLNVTKKTMTHIDRPKWIIVDQIKLETERDGNTPYTITASLFSVMDGYVDIDSEFEDPRSFPPNT